MARRGRFQSGSRRDPVGRTKIEPFDAIVTSDRGGDQACLACRRRPAAGAVGRRSFNVIQTGKLGRRQIERAPSLLESVA